MKTAAIVFGAGVIGMGACALNRAANWLFHKQAILLSFDSPEVSDSHLPTIPAPKNTGWDLNPTPIWNDFEPLAADLGRQERTH